MVEEVKPEVIDNGPDVEEEEEINVEDRKKEYCNLKRVEKQLDDLYELVVNGFDDKQEQSENIDRYWDVYNCVLNENQAYFGNSQVYVSAVADATDALITRDNNMLFPVNGRYAAAVGPNGTVPYEILALLDYYVRMTEMRQNIVPCLLRTGTVTGHYTVLVGWKETVLNTVRRVKTSTVMSELDTPVDGAEEVDDVEEEQIKTGQPTLQVLDPRDVCILPATIDSQSDATVSAIRLHLSKAAIQDYIDDGTFDEDAGKMLLANFDTTPAVSEIDTTKKATAQAGVRVNSKGSKVAVVYMVWSKIKLKDKEKRLCVSYFAGSKIKLSCKRNPYWNDRIPVLSQPARKMPGSIWGQSVYAKVEDIQYALNDVINESLDSSQYSMMPITATDPAKNPRTGSMVLTMGALWEVDPNSTKFMEFPQLWKEGFAMAGSLSDRIMQSMGINPAFLPHGNAGKKPTQAQISQEQQVAQEASSNTAAILESSIFNQILEWFHDLDYQYREKPITVKQFGQMGLQAKMLEVPPLETYTAYTFRWYGTEGTKAVQQVQQQIAAMNVLRGIPPEQLNGRKVDIGPVIEQIAEVAFGPRVAPNVLIDQRHQLSMNPMEENELIQNSFPVSVQAMDNDIEHLKAHMIAAQGGDPNQLFQLHILAHMNQLNQKSQMSAGQPKGSPGTPGGAAPGLPGVMAPRIGAQPGAVRSVQAPPGAVHADQMQDPNRMPS